MPDVYDSEKKDEGATSTQDILDAEKNIGAPTSKTENGTSKAGSDGKSLGQKEEAASEANSSGKSLGDSINDKLGKGYNGDTSKKTTLSKMFNSKSGMKKKIAIAGAAAGTSAIGGVLMFFILLPLKVEHVITNVTKEFASSATDAVDKQVSGLMSAYIAKAVIPGITSGRCHSTIDPTCVGTIDGKDGPVKALFVGWKEARLEQKLAAKYGIVFGKNGNNLVMNLNGKDFDLRGAIGNNKNIFDEVGTTQASKQEIRRAVKAAFKDATLYDRTFMRYKVWKLLAAKYGVGRCLLTCKLGDKISESSQNKKTAAKAFLYRNLYPDKYGLVMQCVMDPAICTGDLDNSSGDDNERLTKFQKELRAQLTTYRDSFGSDGQSKLEELIKTAESRGKSGLAGYAASSIVEKVAGKFGGDAAAAKAGDITSKAVPVVGWIALIAGVVSAAENLGPALQHASYATNSATAVQTYSTFATSIDEIKSGNGDLEALGSFSTVLSTNMSGAQTDQLDMGQSPLYGSIMGTSSMSTTASILSSIIPGTAYAAGSSYTCEDGNAVPADKLVCAEETLAQGNDFANNVSSFVGNIPVLPEIAGTVHGITTTISGAIGDALNAIPGINTVMNWVGEQLSSVVGWVTGKLISTPFTENMNGARTFNMTTAGADVAMNKACQVELGCQKISDVAAAQKRDERRADEKATFSKQPLFARIFDASSSYSLVSQVAISMPGNTTQASSSSLASLVTNPIAKLGSVFSSPFGKQKASAASAQDPFGVIQYGYNDADIPVDAEGFWDLNCVSGPLATYDASTAKLDVSAWLNGQQMDPTTGEAVAGSSNPCLLIKASVQSAGALFGIPQDGETSAAPATPAAGGPNAGYGATAEQLTDLPEACKNGTATGSVKVLCVGAKYRNLVPYLMVHPYTGKEFSQKWASGVRGQTIDERGRKTTLTLDCSLFVGTVLYEAYGIDVTTTSGEYVNKTEYFKRIPMSEAQPGDIFHAPGHIGLVLVPGQKVFDTGWTHPTSPIGDLDVHGWNKKTDYILRYIGPGANDATITAPVSAPAATTTSFGEQLDRSIDTSFLFGARKTEFAA